MAKFIGSNDIKLLSMEQIVRSIYTEDKQNQLKGDIQELVSYIKSERFGEFVKKLKETSMNFKNTDILTHKIDLNDIIYPYKYLSKGSYGATFLAKIKKQKKVKKPGDNAYVVVKYEIVRDSEYDRCQKKYFQCIDDYKDEEQRCKVKEIYCRFESAFDEIYMNKNYLQKLKCRNFAMFYAFFICPSYNVVLEDGKNPTEDFLNKFIEHKKFCIQCTNNFLESEKMSIFSVYEHIPGVTLSKYIKSKSFSLNSLFQIFLQIFGALSIAQKPGYIYYNHNDLHCNNVMVQNYPSRKSYKYEYIFPQEKTRNCVVSNKRAVIIDQGSASLLFRDTDSGKYSAVFGWLKKSMEKRVKNFNSPFADVYRIITNVYEHMLSTNIPENNIAIVKKIVDDLFSLDEDSDERGFLSFFSKNQGLSTICSDFIENNDRVWYENYIDYIKNNLSEKNSSTLIKKIEKITYEDAYNYLYNYLGTK